MYNIHQNIDKRGVFTMFKQLVYTLLNAAGYTGNNSYAMLGYKTNSALHSAIQNKDIKLTVLANICKLCNFQIIITNNNGITINILDYIKQHTTAATDNEQEN